MASVAIIIFLALGFAARQVGLPPLVGYRVAGFAVKVGVHAAYNFFEEAGAGLAEAAHEKLQGQIKGKK